MCDMHARMSINTILSQTSNRQDSVLSRSRPEYGRLQMNRFRHSESLNVDENAYLGGNTLARCSIQIEGIEMVSKQKISHRNSNPFGELKFLKYETETLIKPTTNDNVIRTEKLQKLSCRVRHCSLREVRL